METEWILRIVLVGIIHWLLVALVLPDVVARPRIVGGRKAPWVLAIVFLTCFGSLIYLMFHPQIAIQGFYVRDVYHDKKEDYDCR